MRQIQTYPRQRGHKYKCNPRRRLGHLGLGFNCRNIIVFICVRYFPMMDEVMSTGWVMCIVKAMVTYEQIMQPLLFPSK